MNSEMKRNRLIKLKVDLYRELIIDDQFGFTDDDIELMYTLAKDGDVQDILRAAMKLDTTFSNG